MKTDIKISLLLLLAPALSTAQTPVDEYGNAIDMYESGADIMPIGDDGIPRLSQTDLQDLIGPIALYPDELLAVVLPAAAYPLQIVEAARFLEALESDPTLKPNPDWDDSIIALLNYPDVVDLLNKDLDWTWRLGEAVVAQQTDVISAVESFRDRAFAAGNLKSDSYQTVSRNDGVISISPMSEDVIYVPYYEPARVVHYQPRPVYYYYPQPRPVYYYPYAAGHYFDRGHFWGVTTAFSIGWASNSLHVYHPSYYGHPYYGRTYWNDRWYRSPSINVYNTTYVSNTSVAVNRHSHGDRWRAKKTRREYVRREGYARTENRTQWAGVAKTRKLEPIRFRERESRPVTPSGATSRRATQARNSLRQETLALSSRNTRHQEPLDQYRDRNRNTRRTDNAAPSIESRRQESARQTHKRSEPRTERAPVSKPKESRHQKSNRSAGKADRPKRSSKESTRRSRKRDDR